MKDRILIVDDEPTICSLIGRRLTREGYSCVTPNNGKEGLRRMKGLERGCRPCDSGESRIDQSGSGEKHAKGGKVK